MKESEVLAFAEYLQNSVSMDTLERMTSTLAEELVDSRKVMTEMKTMFDSACNSRNVASGANPEVISGFLEADMPNLLMPDMESDINNVLKAVKKYAKELENNISSIQPEAKTSTGQSSKEICSLNFERYAMANLNRLNVKLIERAHDGKRNPELEEKLTQVFENINTVVKAIESKTAISEWNKNGIEIPTDYEISLNISEELSRLLANVNEVLYLFQRN